MGLLLAACTQKPLAPLFTVVDVEPAARVIGTDASFTVRFSEDVDGLGVNADTVVLVATERVNTSFLSDLNNPPLSQDRRAAAVPLELAVSGASVTARPLAALPPGTALSLLVSMKVTGSSGSPLVDATGKEAHHRVDYATRGPQPRVLTTSLPSGNPPLVPPNLRAFTLTVDLPVENVSLTDVTVTGQQGAQDVAIESIEVLLDGVTVDVTLRDGTCAPLCPNAVYLLSAAGGLRGRDGQALTPFSLEFRALADGDHDGPALVRLPVLQPAEDQVAMALVTREPARGRLRVGPPGGPYAQQFVVFPAGGCTGFQAARECPYSVVATGLDLGLTWQGNTYGGRLELTDDFGNTSLYGEFTLTTVLLPRLKVTEVYNNPPGGPTEEKALEFVEVANTSEATTYDLATMSLAAQDPATGVITADMDLVAYAGGSSLLPPGERAVLGGRLLDPGALGVSAGTVVMLDADTSRETFLRGLSSGADSRKVLALYAGGVGTGAPRVSFYSAPVDLYAPGSTFPEGVSAERLDLVTADADAAWCHSPGGPTPGRANSVEGLPACP
ncbi:MAG: hypothetical protein HY904_07020 [Deltaproteobacteria bacterium]|nr:hypothetical protein [Deltaproteobacteria bacterium]